MLNIALVKSDKSKQMFAIGIIFSKKALKLMTTSALNTLDSPAHQFVDEKFYVNNSKKKRPGFVGIQLIAVAPRYCTCSYLIVYWLKKNL